MAETSITTVFDESGTPQSTDVLDDKQVASPELDIEVVDDTPPEDRNRQPLGYEPEIPDDELENYSEKVKKRISEMKRGYHDERRAKESAERREQEAIRYANMIMEENKQLKSSLAVGEQMFLNTLAGKVVNDMEAAKRELKDAHERGDTDAIATAQEKMARITYEIESWKRYQPQYQNPQALQTPLQQQSYDVYNQQQQAVHPQPAPTDEKAVAWATRNPWFGSDSAMTGFAFGVHEDLVRSGIDPRSDEYYEYIDSRMRDTFPQKFASQNRPAQNNSGKRASTVVAPASRSHGGSKVRLTASQVAIAKRLGVPLEEYAKQVMLKENA